MSSFSRFGNGLRQAWASVGCLVGLVLCGCSPPMAFAPDADPRDSGLASWEDVQLEAAVNGLNRLHEFANIRQFSHPQIEETRKRQQQQILSGEPRFAWLITPAEDAHQQVADRLNQWIRAQPPLAAWKPEQALATLSPEERALVDAGLEELTFTRHDVERLQEAVWLRNLGLAARGERSEDLAQAEALFDWTVRNIALRDAPAGPPRWPWQTLLLGEGTVEDRCWLFLLLCRQQQLPAVVLEIEAEGSGPRLWAVAVHSGGQLYLFDPRLGLPIPGPDGSAAATLAQLAAEPELLRKLDLADRPYPVQAGDLARVAARIEASSLYLARRSAIFGARLSGAHRLTLTADADRLTQRLAGLPGLARTTLWSYPYQTMKRMHSLDDAGRTAAAAAFEPMNAMPQLWQARLLHLEGLTTVNSGQRLPGELKARKRSRDEVAGTTYHKARPSTARIDAREIPDDRKAQQKNSRGEAAYWLAMLTFELRQYDAATDYLKNGVLGEFPDSPRTADAKYLLARSHEAAARRAAEAAAHDTSAAADKRRELEKLQRTAQEQAAAGDMRRAKQTEALARQSEFEVEAMAKNSRQLTIRAREQYQAALPLYAAEAPQAHGNQLRAQRVQSALAALPEIPAEPKPAESKPVESKPAEPKPAEKTD